MNTFYAVLPKIFDFSYICLNAYKDRFQDRDFTQSFLKPSNTKTKTFIARHNDQEFSCSVIYFNVLRSQTD